MQIILRRLMTAIPALLVLSFVVFVMLEFTPGDATDAILNETVTEEAREQMREELGYNQSLPVRYIRYIGSLLRGDFGVSPRTGRDVKTEIATRLPYTLKLASAAITIGIIIGVSLGTVAAMKHNTRWDTAITGLVSVGMALPTFWVAMLLVSLFSLRLGWFPVFGADTPRHLILPAVSASLALIPGIVRITRTSLLETMGRSHVLVAKSKGLAPTPLLLRHIYTVAAIPVVTYLGMQVIQLISSIVAIEIIFNWPGLGGLAVQAAMDRDPPLLQGTTLTIAMLTFTVLLVVDIIVFHLDPRILHQEVQG